MSAPVVAVRLRALGDLTLCTAALHSLAEGHPGREVHVVTESRFAPLLEGQPQIARVWPVERTNLSTLRVVLALRSLRPAVAVDFFGNSRSAVIARLSGARHVWGFDVRGRSRFYHHTVPRVQHAGEEQREYAAASQLRLARAGTSPTVRAGSPAPARARHSAPVRFARSVSASRGNGGTAAPPAARASRSCDAAAYSRCSSPACCTRGTVWW